MDDGRGRAPDESSRRMSPSSLRIVVVDDHELFRRGVRALVSTIADMDVVAEASVFAAMRAGARGYVRKDMDGDDFARALQVVGNGEAIFSRAIASRMMAFFAQPRPTSRPFPP